MEKDYYYSTYRADEKIKYDLEVREYNTVYSVIIVVVVVVVIVFYSTFALCDT